MGDPDTGSSRDLPIVVTATPATDRQRKIALGAIITMAVIFAVTLPFASVHLVRIDAFVLATQSVMCAADLLTAALLFSQYAVYPQRAVLALASGYVFSGLFAFLEACTFPGVFAHTIYIGDELNTPAWLFTFWHTVFPLAVIVYVVWKDEAELTKPPKHIIAIIIACVVAATAGLTWLATAEVAYLPRIYESANVLAPFTHYAALFLFVLSAAALVLLFVRRYTILDQWLMVVLLAWLPTFAVASLFTAVQFTLGWYIARVFALFAGSSLLFALLAETVGLHTRLANAIVRLRQVGRIEHRLAAIVESSDDAIISTDLNGVITTWNKGAERLFGYSEVEATGKQMRTILLPPDRQNELGILQRVHLVGQSIDHFETVRRRKDGSLVNVSLSAFPISESGKIVGTSRMMRDITERKRAEDALRASEAELQAVLSQTPFMLIRCSRDLRYRFVSQAYARWLGRPREEVIGATIMETVGTTAFNTVRPYIEQVLRGTPVDFECERDFPEIGTRRINVAYRPELDAGGNVDGWIASVLDVTEQRRAQERQRLLLAELDHRVKNILAQVAAVATSTRRGSRSIEEFLELLDGRLQAMAIAHTLLSAAGWRSVGLGTLVRNEFAPYATDSNITISGPDVLLRSAETQAVARVLHELTTNAVKYGALSISGGQVSVSWDLKPNGAGTNLTLLWRELGGPPVASERPSGYGTNLISNLIPHELGGAVDLVFAKVGVNCRIEIPIRQV